MIIFKHVADIQVFLADKINKECTIGFVPTMGALHQGHLSLIQRSKAENEITVCSIFINPTQFNNKDDFAKYPVTIENDIHLLESVGCDILFLPDKNEIYPTDFKIKHFEIGYLEHILEGKFRPGHFQGVCLVVDRLLQIIACTTIYLGKKDFQQCMVIQKMMETHHPQIHVVLCDTMREPEGLAMSSRNQRLNDEDKKSALVLIQSLKYIQQHAFANDLQDVLSRAKNRILEQGFELDYLTVCDQQLNEIESFSEEAHPVALVAASINGVRLIDNITLDSF